MARAADLLTWLFVMPVQITSAGQFGAVARPVAAGVSGPSGCGSWGGVQEFGEDGCGDLGGELDQCGASCGEGSDAE